MELSGDDAKAEAALRAVCEWLGYTDLAIFEGVLMPKTLLTKERRGVWVTAMHDGHKIEYAGVDVRGAVLNFLHRLEIGPTIGQSLMKGF